MKSSEGLGTEVNNTIGKMDGETKEIKGIPLPFWVCPSSRSSSMLPLISGVSTAVTSVAPVSLKSAP